MNHFFQIKETKDGDGVLRMMGGAHLTKIFSSTPLVTILSAFSKMHFEISRQINFVETAKIHKNVFTLA